MEAVSEPLEERDALKVKNADDDDGAKLDTASYLPQGSRYVPWDLIGNLDGDIGEWQSK